MDHGLVRVSVASATRRVDLALPSAIPLVELLPELARATGALDASVAAEGYVLGPPGGPPLLASAGLADQGVQDGALLVLSSGHVPLPRPYDDVAEAVADAVERGLVPWSARAGRRTALVVATLLLALGALAAPCARSSAWLSGGVAGTAVLLVGMNVAAARSGRPVEMRIALAWLSIAYAATAGLLLAPPGAEPIAAGLGGLAACALAMSAVPVDRALLVPPVALSGLAVIVGLVAAAQDGPDAARVLLTALALVVLAGGFAPAAAAALVHVDLEPLRADRVVADVRLAQQVLLGLHGAVAAVLLVVAPVAVALGPAAAGLAADAALVVMVRTRRYRSAAHRLIGVVSGAGAVVLGIATGLLVHPAWRPFLVALPVIIGVGALLATLVPGTARRSRAAEVLEALATTALVPLLVAALGLVTWARDRGAPPW